MSPTARLQTHAWRRLAECQDLLAIPEDDLTEQRTILLQKSIEHAYAAAGALRDHLAQLKTTDLHQPATDS